MKGKSKNSRKTWSSLMLGKYKYKTLPQVIFLDPDWFFWAYKDGAFENKGTLESESEEIYNKACSIRIPRQDHENYVVDYYFNLERTRIVRFDIVPASQPTHDGSSPTLRLDKIDLSLVRKGKTYDKLGGRKLIKSLKQCYFKNSRYQMTRERCEDFFNNDDNFLLSD